MPPPWAGTPLVTVDGTGNVGTGPGCGGGESLGGQLGRLADALLAQASATSELVQRHGRRGSGDAVLDALGGSEGGPDGPSGLSGARGAAAMELWRRQVRDDPERVSLAIRRAAMEANMGGPEAVEDTDSRTRSLREYFAANVGFDKARGLAYCAWALAAMADLMGAGRWREAEATLLLTLASIEQVTLDDGRWTVAWLFCHLPEPPWSRLSHRPPQNQLRPFTRLLPPAWTSAAAAYVKDMATLRDLKGKSQAAAAKAAVEEK